MRSILRKIFFWDESTTCAFMPSMRYSKLIWVVVLLFGLPCVAHANAGTPLIWGGFFHLYIGNALIGILEGKLLKRMFHGKCFHAVVMMILANYFSAICGYFFRIFLQRRWVDAWTLNNFRLNALLLAVVLWLLTIGLELPFVRWAMEKSIRNWQKALKCSLIIQSISYILLIGWYILCGSNSLMTCKVVRPDEITVPDGICIYYISSQDMKVYKMCLGRNEPDLVSDQILSGEEVKLFAIQETPESEKADLIAVNFQFFGPNTQVPILPQLADAGKALLEPLNEKGKYEFSKNHWYSRPLGDAVNSNHRFEAPTYYPDRGMSLLTKCMPEDKDRYYNGKPNKYGFNRSEWKNEGCVLALASPLVAWNIFNVIQLPNDIVLLEMNKQLCLFDYKTRRIALLARGFGATAILE